MTIYLLLILTSCIFIAYKVNRLYKLTLVEKLHEYAEIAVSESIEEKLEEECEDGILLAEEFIIRTKKASTSALQTEFRWGYNTAAKIMGMLEEEGIIGPMRQGERFREVLKKEE